MGGRKRTPDVLGGLMGGRSPKKEKATREVMESVAVEAPPEPRPTLPVPPQESLGLKRDLEKVSVFITKEQRDFLVDFSKNIMRVRNKENGAKRERITSNSVLRSMISAMIPHLENFDSSGIEFEHQIKERFLALFPES